MSQGLGRRRSLRDFLRKLGLSNVGADRLQLFDIALTHDSYAWEHTGHKARAVSNERLEFLGDAVLGAITAHWLYNAFPQKREGVLSRARALLVSRGALSQTAQLLGIGPMLLLGRGESAGGGAQRSSILAAAVEALIGAIYLSAGYEAARKFLVAHHFARAQLSELIDPKTALQEYAQARFKKAPHYAITAQSGPPHARVFTVAVEIGGAVAGRGQGATKKQAETAAAREALEHLP